LGRGFQHKHAREHWELREVVGHVFFGQGDVLDRRKLDIRRVGTDSVEQPKTHELEYYFGVKDRFQGGAPWGFAKGVAL
jgi:hypothetical protein